MVVASLHAIRAGHLYQPGQAALRRLDVVAELTGWRLHLHQDSMVSRRSVAKAHARTRRVGGNFVRRPCKRRGTGVPPDFDPGKSAPLVDSHKSAVAIKDNRSIQRPGPAPAIGNSPDPAVHQIRAAATQRGVGSCVAREIKAAAIGLNDLEAPGHLEQPRIVRPRPAPAQSPAAWIHCVVVPHKLQPRRGPQRRHVRVALVFVAAAPVNRVAHAEVGPRMRRTEGGNTTLRTRIAHLRCHTLVRFGFRPGQELVLRAVHRPLRGGFGRAHDPARPAGKLTHGMRLPGQSHQCGQQVSPDRFQGLSPPGKALSMPVGIVRRIS